MSKDLRFSVIILAYNQENYIKETICSILNQTYSNFEVIVADDSSSDGTANVVKSINDERIRYTKTPYNIGINGNLMNGVEKSTGDVIVMLGGDDKLRPSYLEKMNDVFLKSSVDVAYCYLTLIDQNSNYPKGEDYNYFLYHNISKEDYLRKYFLEGNLVPSPGMAVKREVFCKILPLDVSAVVYQDYAIHINLLLNGARCEVVEDILVEYRQFNDFRNISHSGDVTTMRQFVETDSLMNLFLQIKDLELLKQIFKQEIRETKIDPYSDTIPFFLGRVAMLSKDEFKRFWGYKTAAKFVSSPQGFKLVNERYNFTYGDLLKLIKNVTFKDTIRYKKYKNIFKKLLYVLIVENLLFIIGLILYFIFKN